MRLFLSHITEEAPVAKVLKEWIESTFPGHLEVFASTNPSDNPIGTKWIQTVHSALRDSELLILIGSPASISRPWINFEAGAAWIRDIDIITLCHSGLATGSLPPPLSEFQSVSISDTSVTERLFKRFADKLGLTKLPRIPFEQFHRELTEATEIGCLNTITRIRELSGSSRPISCSI